jgi:shikimate dehydrogenase
MKKEDAQMIDGATRLFGIVGDPIAHVKAPTTLTRLFAARGINAVMVPIQVSAAGFDAFMAGVKATLNLDGLMITVPHKEAVFRHVARPSPRAQRVGSIDVIRRDPDGAFAGDVTDGLGLLGALRAAGFEPPGRTALVVGCDGVGAAIAGALIEAGASRVVVSDADADKVTALAARLGAQTGTADPRGYDLVVNATPLGLRPDDPLPLDATVLTASQFVGEVNTLPEMTPLLVAAQARGCRFATGPQMVEAQSTMVADFVTAHMARSVRDSREA